MDGRLDGRLSRLWLWLGRDGLNDSHRLDSGIDFLNGSRKGGWLCHDLNYSRRLRDDDGVLFLVGRSKDVVLRDRLGEYLHHRSDDGVELSLDDGSRNELSLRDDLVLDLCLSLGLGFLLSRGLNLYLCHWRWFNFRLSLCLGQSDGL